MSAPMAGHEVFMGRAMELARFASGQTHPNPLVGAVIVEAGEIVAEGWHHAAGKAHAEVEALNALGRSPKEGAILYVTLEPCSTQGQTGACTSAIVTSGIKKVVVGAVDPNPAHAGAGLEVLKQAGLEVLSGVLAGECTDLNLIFNHWIQKESSFIAMKIATTLDGKFGAANGYSKWITGGLARTDVMLWRKYFPAIAVSANTVLADNPALTVRLENEPSCPRRFILDRELITLEAPVMLKVYTDEFCDLTTVVCSEKVDTRLKKLAIKRGLKIWELPEVNKHLDFKAFRDRLSAEGIFGLYLEAGPRLATALLENSLVDYLLHYIAPKYQSDSGSVGIGSNRETQSMEASIRLSNVEHRSYGDDILVRGYV